MSLERLKIQKFLTQGKGTVTPLSLNPIPRSIGPSGLGALSPPKRRPLRPRHNLAAPGKKLVAPMLRTNFFLHNWSNM